MPASQREREIKHDQETVMRWMADLHAVHEDLSAAYRKLRALNRRIGVRPPDGPGPVALF